MATIQEMREERAKCIAEARKILDSAASENRELTSEQSAKADDLLDRADQLAKEIKAKEDAESRARRIEEAERALEEVRNRPPKRFPPQNHSVTRNVGATEEENGVSWRLAGGGERRFVFEGKRATPEYRSAFEQYLRTGNIRGLDFGGEHRDNQADDGPSGGYLLAPVQMIASLIQAVDNAVPLRQFATVFQVRNSQSLGVPVLETDISDADWTTEIKTGTNDTSLKFGKRELNPTPVAKRILVSRKLLRMAVMPVEEIVRERLAYKFGVTQEKAFMTGDGANQPLGIFTASANGISTSRDVLTGSSTDITADGLIDAKFTLKAAYWSRPSTRWFFHRDAMRRIRKLKGSDNNYLWQPGLSAGEPDRILDIPYVVSEYVPNTFTTGQYVGALGDFSFYWIAEALSLEVQILDQLYAETNRVGYIGRMELDGMPVLEEAFVRMKTN